MASFDVAFSRFCWPNHGWIQNFQAMMLEMRQNSWLIELMDRRLSAEEKRQEEAA